VEQYLFVFTRNISNDPSAGHLLRIALGVCGRAHDVTVFLTDNAIGGTEHGAADLIERLRRAGVRVIADGGILGRARLQADQLGVEPASDDELCALLLTPGVSTHWC